MLFSAAIVIVFVSPTPASVPAAQDLSASPFELGRFELVDQSGRSVDNVDLSESVWVASFIFTRCPSSCPRISARMKELQDKLKRTDVRLVSITVDPEHDTPEVLSSYAKRYDAEPDRWSFLTGNPSQIYNLILEGFRLSVSATTDAERKSGAEAVAHSDKLALVDRGNRVVGLFASDESSSLQNLLSRSRLLDTEGSWVRTLPAVNACLNASCGALLLLGWLFIRSGQWKPHAFTMAAAVTVSAVFLSSYLVYHFFVGSVPYRGTGFLRLAYFTILLSHTTLATFGVVPLVSLTLWRVAQRRFVGHARIASVTLPIWLYVSITGVIIYWMLYRIPVPDTIG